MSLVKINALAIPPQAGDEIVKRFAARLDEMAQVDGFEGFELLQPTGEAETRWFVYTRWRDEDAYQAWRNGDTFAASHANAGGGPGGGGGQDENAAQPRPLSTGATLLEFEVRLAGDGPTG